jgi:hypothetical protein
MHSRSAHNSLVRRTSLAGSSLFPRPRCPPARPAGRRHRPAPPSAHPDRRTPDPPAIRQSTQVVAPGGRSGDVPSAKTGSGRQRGRPAKTAYRPPADVKRADHRGVARRQLCGRQPDGSICADRRCQFDDLCDRARRMQAGQSTRRHRQDGARLEDAEAGLAMSAPQAQRFLPQTPPAALWWDEDALAHRPAPGITTLSLFVTEPS